MGNDDAVHTALDARRQETCSANWNLASEDETPQGREILEFVEDNIYPLFDDCSAGSPAARCSTGSAASSRSSSGATRRSSRRSRAGRSSERRSAASAGSTCRSSRTSARPRSRRSRSARPATSRRRSSTSTTARRSGGPRSRREGAALDVQPAGRRLLGRAADAALLQGVDVQDAARAAERPAFDRFGVGVPVAEEPKGGFTPLERSRSRDSSSRVPLERSLVRHPPVWRQGLDPRATAR
jgi:hypothetical protein